MRSKLEADIAEVLRRYNNIGSFIVVAIDDSGDEILAASVDAASPADLSSLFHTVAGIFLGAFARISGLPHYAARPAMEGLLGGAEDLYVERLQRETEARRDLMETES